MSKNCRLTDQLNLCEQQKETFKKVLIYFDGLDLDLILGSDTDDFIDFAEPKDKIMMRIFVDKILKPKLQEYDMSLIQESVPKIKQVTFQNGRLDASQQCLSPVDFKLTDKLNVTDLQSEILKVLKNNEKICYMDLSCNFLLDRDLVLLNQVIQNLDRSQILINLVLNLTFNRIHGYIGDARQDVPRALLSILNNKNIQFVQLSQNPFCTIDRRDFFYHLNGTDIVSQKLIWIQKNMLESRHWTIMLKDLSACDAIEKVHQKFYAKFQ